MTENKPMLTEESIGKTFDHYFIDGKKLWEVEIIDCGKSFYIGKSYLQYANTYGYFIFDKYGVQLGSDGDYYLKPQQEKINLWEWIKKLPCKRYITIPNLFCDVELIAIYDYDKISAIISLEEMTKRNWEYFYIGEGL